MRTNRLRHKDARAIFSPEVGTRICRDVFQKAGRIEVNPNVLSLQVSRADARIRTADPFITSDG